VVRSALPFALSRLAGMLALAVGLAACAAGGGARSAPGADAGAGGAPAPAELTILYFNDLHGHLVPFTREGDTTRVGGAARMATLVQRVRAENRLRGRPTLLLEGGDIFQGTPLSSVFKGEPDFRFLNMIGLDAMVLGNHEFDFGIEILRQRIQEANFPVLAANVLHEQGGGLLARPYVLRTLSNGVRVAIIGFVTDDTPETTDPLNVSGLVFQPPLLAASRYLPALEDSADVLLGLTHIGREADKLLADTFDELDVIVGGHDQVLIHKPLQMGDVLIAQAAEHGLYLGRVDLTVEGDEVELVADTVYPITGAIPDDPAVAQMVASYTRRLDRELNKTVGRLSTPLNGERHEIRLRPTNFGLLLTTLMKDLTGADFAVLNSGAVRASIDSGPVTLGEIIQALPFANQIMTVQLSGEAVERLLAQSLSVQRHEDGGGFLQVAGIRYEAGSAGPTAITIAGEPLDGTRTYTVATTDFLFHGGDGYDLFRRLGKNPKDTGLLLAQVLSDHIRKNSPLSVPNP
jgi:5'-nucleotidase/UDP-sugar diphosphatase